MMDVSLKEGLRFLEEGIVKARQIIQGYPDTQFSAAEYQAFYTCLYDLCGPENREFHGARLVVYDRFNTSLEESINMMVLPSLVNKRGVDFLRTLDMMWSNYNTMGRCLCKIFECLDHLKQPLLHPLQKVVESCFSMMVLHPLFKVLEEAVKGMVIYQCRGYQIDKELLKRVFKRVEVADFDVHYGMLENSYLSVLLDYYVGLAPLWLRELSALDYVKNACRSLLVERERASYYLRHNTLVNFEQVFKFELFHKYANELTSRMEVERHNMKPAYQEILSSAGRNPEYQSSMRADALLALLIEICAHTVPMSSL